MQGENAVTKSKLICQTTKIPPSDKNSLHVKQHPTIHLNNENNSKICDSSPPQSIIYIKLTSIN